MESREVASDMSTDLPQWAVVTVAIVICVAFALAIIIVVGAVGHCCVCGRKGTSRTLRSWIFRRSGCVIFAHPELMANAFRRTLPDSRSVDSIPLALAYPPPAYLHPPRYQAPFNNAGAMEEGAAGETIGKAA